MINHLKSLPSVYDAPSKLHITLVNSGVSAFPEAAGVDAVVVADAVVVVAARKRRNSGSPSPNWDAS